VQRIESIELSEEEEVEVDDLELVMDPSTLQM